MRITIAFVLMFLAGGAVASAQTDADRFAEGRIALEKYKDCPAARTALEAIPGASPVRQDPIFAFFMARTYECLNVFDFALKWYQFYAQRVPPTAETLDKIGDLRYRLQKETDRRQKEAARAEEEAERARQLQARLEAIRQSIPTLFARLRAFFDPPRTWLEPDYEPSWTVSPNITGPGVRKVEIRPDSNCAALKIHQERLMSRSTTYDERSATYISNRIDDVSIDLTVVTSVELSSIKEIQTSSSASPAGSVPAIHFSFRSGVADGIWQSEEGYRHARPRKDDRPTEKRTEDFDRYWGYTLVLDRTQSATNADVASVLTELVQACKLVKGR